MRTGDGDKPCEAVTALRSWLQPSTKTGAIRFHSIAKSFDALLMQSQAASADPSDAMPITQR